MKFLPHKMIASASFRRIVFPDLFIVAGSSSAVVFYNQFIVWPRMCDVLDLNHDGDLSAEEIKAGIADSKLTVAHIAGADFYMTPDMVTLPMAPFSLTSFALGLMLAFRNNNCAGRYEEARRTW